MQRASPAQEGNLPGERKVHEVLRSKDFTDALNRNRYSQRWAADGVVGSLWPAINSDYYGCEVVQTGFREVRGHILLA